MLSFVGVGAGDAFVVLVAVDSIVFVIVAEALTDVDGVGVRGDHGGCVWWSWGLWG